MWLAGIKKVDLFLHLMAQPPWYLNLELAPGKPFYIIHYTYGMDYKLTGMKGVARCRLHDLPGSHAFSLFTKSDKYFTRGVNVPDHCACPFMAVCPQESSHPVNMESGVLTSARTAASPSPGDWDPPLRR